MVDEKTIKTHQWQHFTKKLYRQLHAKNFKLKKLII